MTTSVEAAFGSHVMTNGFILNNQLTDFSFVPEENGKPVANRIEPGKRPRSSMAPTLVFDRKSGELVATVGSPGGSQIIEYVNKAVIGLVDWKLDPQQAISLPNFGSRNVGTEVEAGLVSPALIQQLKDRGHDVSVIDMTSGTQIIEIKMAGPPGPTLAAKVLHWGIEPAEGASLLAMQALRSVSRTAGMPSQASQLPQVLVGSLNLLQAQIRPALARPGAVRSSRVRPPRPE